MLAPDGIEHQKYLYYTNSMTKLPTCGAWGVVSTKCYIARLRKFKTCRVKTHLDTFFSRVIVATRFLHERTNMATCILVHNSACKTTSTVMINCIKTYSRLKQSRIMIYRFLLQQRQNYMFDNSRCKVLKVLHNLKGKYHV